MSTELECLNSDGDKVATLKDASTEKPSDTKDTGLDNQDSSWLETDVECVNQDRGVWANKFEFFLAIMGYTVGIGSVWRFPIICSRNGGGAFLIPFFFFLITSGGPLYYLEVCLGQFTGQSAGLAFEFCSLSRGLGILQVALSLCVLWYLISIMVWVLYFLYSSCFSELPWTTCNNPWNTENCTEILEVLTGRKTEQDIYNTSVSLLNDSFYTVTNTDNLSVPNLPFSSSQTNHSNVSTLRSSSSVYEFWEYKVIGRSRGLEDMGSIQPHLVICLFLAWLFCVAAVIKGVKTLGKVVYVTATAPYVFLTIIFIKALTLDGAIDGIKIFVKPDFSKLLTTQVWLEAAVQVFYSLGPSWGGVITMSSYNRFHQKSFWSSTICVAFAGFTAFYNGMVVFTLLGFMAKSSGMTVTEIAKQSGPGLVFVAFPAALSLMPLPQLWSVLFFLMLIAVVFDSLFGMLETVTSGIIDQFPHQLLDRRILVNIITGLCFFITALPLTMNGGIYIFQLADWYFASFALLIGSLFECIAICWIYGTERFARDIYIMTGRTVSVILRIMWTILIPLFVTIAFVALLTKYSEPAYGDGYEYSSGAVAAGIFVGMIPIIAMVVVGIVSVLRQKGSLLKRFKSSLNPSDGWGPYEQGTRRKYEMKPYIYPSTWWQKLVVNITGR
ncbi:sodium- and chloride-dependent betaine transporter-like [Mercenaria mercenaria]|uniref:sodium- and chloride-dependent betaine transporter-like n=1 Tax=Mercenaria mercenaria TaxID=6596 RepID=UPI00234F1E02|nr:sodium- and chloride-dependent betaine transporter-like [Mercenaria mercenaria]XP_053377566.1 sodium- and chloride-dependent betaine transporter-like [Mercenaria mercenaria]